MPGCRVDHIKKISVSNLCEYVGNPNLGCRRPNLNTVNNSSGCSFTETTQFQPTYTVSRLHVATTTVPSGCRVNWAIDILVTFPQLLWLHYSVISYRISPRVPRRSCETMDKYEAQYWEPLLNCCTYSTVYCSAEKNLREYLQKFFTVPVKGWPYLYFSDSTV